MRKYYILFIISWRYVHYFSKPGTPFLSCLAGATWRLVLSYLVLLCLVWPKINHSHTCFSIMMTSSNGNIFRVTGPLCGEFTGPGEFPAQGPVTRSFNVFFDLRLNRRLSKQPWGWWFETPVWSLWRHRNDTSNIGCNCFTRPWGILCICKVWNEYWCLLKNYM